MDERSDKMPVPEPSILDDVIPNPDSKIPEVNKSSFFSPGKSTTKTTTPKLTTPKVVKESKPTPSYRQGALVRPMTQLYVFGGMALMPRSPEIAKTVVENAEQCAKAWDDLARTNQTVRRILYALIETSDWTKVIVAHMPIILTVVQQKGWAIGGIMEVEEYANNPSE